MVILRKQSNRLAKKLMLAVILTSTLITILSTSFQLYSIYSRDISEIDARLTEIKNIHVESISSLLWNSDYEQLSLRVESMIHVPDMLYIEIKEKNKPSIRTGTHHDNQIVQEKFDLTYFYRGEKRTIGEMIVQFDLGSIYDRLWSQLIDILISNSLKTFLISFIILWIFFQMVTRHIRELSDHAMKLTTNNLDETFTYSHKSLQPGKVDELDILSDAFNEMKRNMSQGIKELELSRLETVEREQFYSSILDMNTAIIYVKDKYGQFIFLNRECENLFGINRSETDKKTVHDIFDPEIASEQVKNDKTVLKSRVPIEFQERIIREDKEHTYISIKFPLYDENNIIYAVGCVSTDVTSLKEARDLLNQKTIEQEEILNNLIDGVITINEDFTIGSVNQAAEQILGYREKELSGQDISILMRNEDKPKFLMLKDSLIRIISKSHIGTSREFYARRKNSDEFPLQLSLNRLPDDNDGQKRFIISFIDLKELKEKETLLRQSMKLEALGKLTGGIAHDYNNMLGVVMGYAELISLNYSDDQTLSDYIHQISHACERGTKLTKKLLNFSSYKGNERTCLNLYELFNDMKNMIEKTLTVRIKLDIDIKEDIWDVLADQSELEDAILNICINAMHAMPSGGELRIELANISIKSIEADIFDLKAGNYVRLSFIDNGCGMSLETQARIFDPFYTTKGSKGSGLGLSQVYGFMKRSGGSIHVKSNLDIGTRFILYLPRFTKSIDNQNEIVEKNYSANIEGNEKLLIVEDEDALRFLCVNLFESHGYHVFSAANGIEALPILENNKIDLVISDLLMPEMDGYKLSQYIRDHYPHIKIQLLSGFQDENQNNQLSDDLRSNILQKPVSNTSLLSNARLLLDS